MFSFEFNKIFDNAYLTEDLRTTLNLTLIKINGHKTWQRDLRWNEPEIALAKCINILLTITEIRETEAVIRRCSSKWVFLKILLYSQENTCVGVSFQTFFCTPEGLKLWLQQRSYPINIAKFLRTAFFIEHLWWLVLVKILPNNQFL